MPFATLFSFTEPLGPPSPLAPLSATTITRVLSSSPAAARASSSRPMCWSAWLRNPAVDLGHAREQALLVSRERGPGPGAVERRKGAPVRSGPDVAGPQGIDRRQ